MYTINTQLAYFKYNLDPKNLILNIKWFRLDKVDGLYFGCKAFSKIEIGQFKGFIDQNSANFPGSYFIEETQRQDFGRLKSNELSKTALPPISHSVSKSRPAFEPSYLRNYDAQAH